MKTILFQGDSITDVARSRENDLFFGMGYPTLVKGELGLDCPNQYVMYNRGISGDRVVDLYARIKQDIINLKPDIISILVGVNDAYHEVATKNGVDAEKYFKVYSMLIEEIKGALPNTSIMILEPFVLNGALTQDTEAEPRKWNFLESEVKKRAKKAMDVAKKYGLTFITLQDKFDEALQYAPIDYWTYDGIHPTTAGHEIIKREWIKRFQTLNV